MVNGIFISKDKTKDLPASNYFLQLQNIIVSIRLYFQKPCLITKNHSLFSIMQLISTCENKDNNGNGVYKNNISGIEICFRVEKKERNTWGNDTQTVYNIISINGNFVSGVLTREQEKLITAIVPVLKNSLSS